MRENYTEKDIKQTNQLPGQLYSRRHTLSPSQGGQNGFRNAIAGTDANGRVIQLHADTKHLDTQIIPILMQTPGGFKTFKKTKEWNEALKHMVEVSPESITGLNKTLTVNFVENAVGGAGEIYEQPTKVLRERTAVEFVWKDRVGRPFQNILETWITYLMMDPDTSVPKITGLDSFRNQTWTTDLQTMTVLFIAPDITHRYVDKAWLVTSMMPKTAGESIGRRNTLEDATMVELTIPFTGVAISTFAVELLAEKMLAKLTYIKTDTDFMELAFTEEYAEAGLTNNPESTVGFNAPDFSHAGNTGSLNVI